MVSVALRTHTRVEICSMAASITSRGINIALTGSLSFAECLVVDEVPKFVEELDVG